MSLLWDFSTHLPVLHDTGCCIVPRQGWHQARGIERVEGRGPVGVWMLRCGVCGVTVGARGLTKERSEWRKAIECL